jgi:hypothetical protein
MDGRGGSYGRHSKGKRPRSSHPHQGLTYAVIRTMFSVTVCAMATVEESALLNPSQLVRDIIQACSSLISPDCIRIELCPAIWSVSLREAGLGHMWRGGSSAHPAAAPRSLPAAHAHCTPEGMPRMPCTWTCF